jgi:hypothetical protein
MMRYSERRLGMVHRLASGLFVKPLFWDCEVSNLLFFKG